MSEASNPHTPARPTIFLVEEDDDVRPILTRKLRKSGYRLLVAASLEDAREWVEGEGYIHADLVLINLVGKNLEEALRLGRELCDHAKYDGRTPLVMVPERVPEELVGQNVDVGGHDWVCYDDGESDQLGRLLAHLLHEASD